MISEILVLGGMGILFGLGLAYLSKRFFVKTDPKIAQIRELLPGVNCGSCGYAGCDAFAQAVAKGEDYTKCSPGVSKHADIAKVMGKEVKGGTQRKVARMKCNGKDGIAPDKFDYKGVERCSSAAAVSGGSKMCSYGCLGYGDCVQVCPVGAISIKDGIAVVDEDKCIACGKCVKECPKKLFEIVPADKKVYVKCSSNDMAKDVTKNCKVGCIACRICEKTCQFDAIHVVNNVAKIDYEKCTNCGACVLKCPRKIIVKV